MNEGKQPVYVPPNERKYIPPAQDYRNIPPVQ